MSVLVGHCALGVGLGRPLEPAVFVLADKHPLGMWMLAFIDLDKYDVPAKWMPRSGPDVRLELGGSGFPGGLKLRLVADAMAFCIVSA